MHVTQTEHVLVVPTEIFHSLGYFQGFHAEVSSYLPQLLDPRQISFRARDEMEQDPSFKQLIPYCIIRHIDDDGRVSLFQYTRGKGQGESRLHAMKSVGIGGHISSTDGEGSAAYDEGMRRELDEEVIFSTPYQSSCVGLINDDETPVGRVHLGVVHLIDVESPRVKPREDSIISNGFIQLPEIMADLSGYETWSQHCLAALFGN